MALRYLFISLLFLLAPANALFLAGQSQAGGEISVLCEGQASIFVSSPDGQLRAITLDIASQAAFYPQFKGPYTVQCGNETKTVIIQLPQQEGADALGGESALPIVTGVAIFIAAAIALAARMLLGRKTTFSKRCESGRVSLSLRAGQDLHSIKITDPDGGKGGAALELSIPRLRRGAAWSWEYEMEQGAPLLPARMHAKCKRGEIFLVSGTGEKTEGEKKQVPRKLPKG